MKFASTRSVPIQRKSLRPQKFLSAHNTGRVSVFFLNWVDLCPVLVINNLEIEPSFIFSSNEYFPIIVLPQPLWRTSFCPHCGRTNTRLWRKSPEAVTVGIRRDAHESILSETYPNAFLIPKIPSNNILCHVHKALSSILYSHYYILCWESFILSHNPRGSAPY